jgi:CheY-like chemotaxis protein
LSPIKDDGQIISILIVDDHPVNRMLLKQQLELLGLHVKSAESGTPALTVWQSQPIDLIITDCHMPEMDGYELTRQIRAIEQATGKPRVPVLAWTANVLAEESEHSRSAGMDDMLTKPTELAVLKEMLIKWLVK